MLRSTCCVLHITTWHCLKMIPSHAGSSTQPYCVLMPHCMQRNAQSAQLNERKTAASKSTVGPFHVP